MSPHRQLYSAPARRHPGMAVVADILCAVTLGALLAACLVHWATCEGVC